MKRQLIAAAAMGALALVVGNIAGANECKQVKADESMSCREIASNALGSKNCLVPDRLGLRGVKSGAAADPWVTEQPIKLDRVAVDNSHAPGRCVGRHIDFTGSQLEIAKSGTGYKLKISAPAKVETMLTPTRRDGSDVWLSGTDPNHPDLHYFVFFRDKANGADLPKFLIVEAIDFADGTCKDNAPSLSGTVTEGPCTASAGPQKGADLPGEKETGVGGGGEGGAHH